MEQKMNERSLSEFESAARAFVSIRYPRRPAPSTFCWGEGSDAVGVFGTRDGPDASQHLSKAREWRALKFDHGFGWINGPEEYGGQGLPTEYQETWNRVQAEYATPDEGFFGIGLGMVAPTILVHGSETAKRRYLQALFRADMIACQLFSEPSSGSDLASLQTTATKVGDNWIINGQKVWTSGAHYSDIGEILCRTDRSAPKHAGITAFLIDMKAPGIDARPLRQMTGGTTFNEVFLADVRVPDDHRLGPVNAGWSVATTTLTNERAAIGAGGAGGDTDRLIALLIETCRRYGVDRDPFLRDSLSRVLMEDLIIKGLAARARGRAAAQGVLGPEMSIAKLLNARLLTSIAAVASQALGARAIADTGAWGTFSWSQLLLGAPGSHIGGGTDEILKNVLAERVLGLPKEPTVTHGASGRSS